MRERRDPTRCSDREAREPPPAWPRSRCATLKGRRGSCLRVVPPVPRIEATAGPLGADPRHLRAVRTPPEHAASPVRDRAAADADTDRVSGPDGPGGGRPAHRPGGPLVARHRRSAALRSPAPASLVPLRAPAGRSPCPATTQLGPGLRDHRAGHRFGNRPVAPRLGGRTVAPRASPWRVAPGADLGHCGNRGGPEVFVPVPGPGSCRLSSIDALTCPALRDLGALDQASGAQASRPFSRPGPAATPSGPTGGALRSHRRESVGQCGRTRERR